MKWGPKAGQKVSDAEWLQKIAKETGKIPTAIAKRPEIDAIAELPYWEAFQLLNLSRPNNGFGPCAIQLSEMLAYFTLMQIPPREHLDYVVTIRAMDAAFLAFAREKNG